MQRQSELGEFMGTIIAGIYSGIRNGGFDVISDFSQAAGRDHVDWYEFFRSVKMKIQSE